MSRIRTVPQKTEVAEAVDRRLVVSRRTAIAGAAVGGALLVGLAVAEPTAAPAEAAEATQAAAPMSVIDPSEACCSVPVGLL